MTPAGRVRTAARGATRPAAPASGRSRLPPERLPAIRAARGRGYPCSAGGKTLASATDSSERTRQAGS
ncbi:hypothetical protein GCM10009530_09150 [Microbispora corallina]|uniref:Uncharacterized protein n=1 Tax=Microbispora corallina TaxID=83302 RepID=A0ABQ4FVN5_9ACTN|nr:hypothetical protein Mco01_18780 [Microbispora corallina]